MATISGNDLSGLYGISVGPSVSDYGNANVIGLLLDYQYPINVNNSISATGNVSGNIIVGNTWLYGNGINVISTLYSNANAQSYLPTYSGNTGAVLTTNAQPYITSIAPQVNLTAASNVNVANFWINNVPEPVQAYDAANKQYVDSIAQGLSVKAAVTVATTTTLPGYVYYNGPNNDGIGATITGLSLGLIAIDGVTITPSSRVLVKNEVGPNSPYNGIYVVNRNDAGSTYQLVRATDMDVPQDFYGAYSYVISGNSNGTTSWICVNDCNNPITIGTTAIQFTQFTSTGLYTPGNGITISNAVISVSYDNSSLVLNGNNQLSVNTSIFTNPNIGNATGNSLSVTGNITGSYFIGNGALLTGITTSTYGNANVAAYLPTYTGNLTANVIVANIVSATGNVVGGNISTAGNVTGNYILGDGTYITNLPLGNYGNANVANYLPTYSGTVSLTNIINAGANTTGNIGNSTNYFNTLFATATSALYADLAEKYVGDAVYSPGIVVEFGGPNEITLCQTSHSTAVAGVVSTNPSYIMNSGLDVPTTTTVALTGRVPCSVVGPVNKGDLIVSSHIPGVARVLDEALYRPGCVIGKALESSTVEEVKTIEVVVGRV